MRNKNSQLNFIFFSTLMAILIWMASPTVKGYVNSEPTSFPLHEYEAHYAVSWHGVYAGESVHKLHQLGNGLYHFETRTEPRMRILPFHYVESSDFAWNEGKIVPQNFHYNIKEGKRQKSGNLAFDWKMNKLKAQINSAAMETQIPADIQDKLTQTLCLRHALKTGDMALNYTVAEEDKIKNNVFRLLGEERLNTKLGALDTVKIEHVSRKGHRTTTWFAKKYDYLPVKMVQYRQGKIAASGEILSFKPS